MRATRAIIHLGNLRENFRLIRGRLKSGTRICPAVKADAYGHGAVEVSRLLQEEGTDALAVATAEEALELREAGITVPILLMGLCLPDEYNDIIKADVEPFLSTYNQIEDLDRLMTKYPEKSPLPVHLMTETGMGRQGFLPDQALRAAELINTSPVLKLKGLATHFPKADDNAPEATAFTRSQTDLINRLLCDLAAEEIFPPLIHTANSGAILDHPEAHHTMVRPGILLYGYYPSGDQERTLPVKPVMEFSSAILLERTLPAGSPVSYGGTWKCPKETRIGTVPAGYADGINRHLSNKGEVLVEGRRLPIRGRICMDQFMVEIPDGMQLAPAARAVIFGPDKAGPDAEDVARICGTIPYETLCAVSKRVPRVYRED